MPADCIEGHVPMTIPMFQSILLNKMILALIMKKFFPPASFVRATAVTNSELYNGSRSLWGEDSVMDGMRADYLNSLCSF